MYETKYIIKRYKQIFDKNGNKKLRKAPDKIYRTRAEACADAWKLAEECAFITIEQEETKASRILTIGKIEK